MVSRALMNQFGQNISSRNLRWLPSLPNQTRSLSFYSLQLSSRSTVSCPPLFIKTKLPLSSSSIPSNVWIRKKIRHLSRFLIWLNNKFQNGGFLLRNCLYLKLLPEYSLTCSLTSFPAALQMALCSFIFAVSSRYSSIASMILSAYTDDDKGQKSPQHIPSSQDTAPEGLIRKLPNRLTHFNKDGWQSAKQLLETSLVFLFSLLSNQVLISIYQFNQLCATRGLLGW